MWSFGKVLEALKNIENYKAYYIGVTLCIDFKYGPSVLLNTSGRGSFYSFPDVDDPRFEVKFLMTKEMQMYVRAEYQRKVERREMEKTNA